MAATPAAQREISDLRRYLDDDEHLTPEQLADYRHRLAEYARSGSAPVAPELELEPTPHA